jgi:hypothetical protein
MDDGRNIGHLTDDPSLVERQADTNSQGLEALDRSPLRGGRRFP